MSPTLNRGVLDRGSGYFELNHCRSLGYQKIATGRLTDMKVVFKSYRQYGFGLGHFLLLLFFAHIKSHSKPLIKATSRPSALAIAKECLKNGLKTGGPEDVLAHARDLDALEFTDLQKLQLFGKAIILDVKGGNIMSDSIIQEYNTLRREGALVFQDILIMDCETTDRYGECVSDRNPRDTRFSLMPTPGIPTSASAIRAIAKGFATSAVLRHPTLVTSSCSLYHDVVLPTSHCGVSGLILPHDGTCIVSSSLANSIHVATLLKDYVSPALASTIFDCSLVRTKGYGDSNEDIVSNSATENQISNINAVKLKPTFKANLSGIKIGVSRRCQFLPDVEPEKCVTDAVKVAAETLSRLGAEIIELKSPHDLVTNDFPIAVDLVLSPSTPRAPHIIAEDNDNASPEASVASLNAIPLALSKREDEMKDNAMLLLNCGTVADEDDGYGECVDDELVEREGLPISCTLVSTKSHTGEGLQKLLTAGLAFSENTRWESELFAPKMTRDLVLEDMNDARECFGIFFATTLLRVIGKK